MEKKEAIKILKDFHDESALFSIRNALETLYPEFKESRDEKIRKRLIEFFKDWGKTRSHCWSIYIPDILAWLEKQGKQEPINPELKESEDEKVRKEIVEYLKKNLRLEWATWLEKQGEVESDKDDIEAEEKGIREAFNKIEDEKQCKQKPQRMISAEAKEAMYDKPADKVEPKFKVKYAGSEYNVLEIKEIAGDAYYGIEDEPNHIDYVLPDNCEIIDGYAIKENGSPYPTKSAVFFGAKNPTWSKEDDVMIYKLLAVVELYYDRDGDDLDKQSCIDWLKSLRPQNNITDEELAQAKKDAYNDALDKIEYHSGEPTFDDGWSAAIWYLKKKNAMPQTQWKPSDEQLEALKNAIHIKPFKNPSDSILWRLYEQLKKLKS